MFVVLHDCSLQRRCVLMKRVLIWFVMLLLGAAPTVAQQGKLEIRATKADEAAKKLQFLPESGTLIDADAVPLYGMAVQAIPANFSEKKVREWQDMPVAKLPLNEVGAMLKEFGPVFAFVDQAAMCKQCKWPAWTPDMTPVNLTEYRSISRVLALKARFEIAQGEYEKAISTIRSGFVMAWHIGQSPVLIQDLVAVAMAALMNKEVEQLVQAPGSPNLYWALESLPEPLIDMEKAIQSEVSNIEKKYNALLRKTMLKQSKPAHDRVRLIAQRLSRHLTALQCVEAVRLYAWEHKKLPSVLTDITQVSTPEDPAEKKPFTYRSTGSSGVLKAPIPDGGDAKDAIHYELTLVE